MARFALMAAVFLAVVGYAQTAVKPAKPAIAPASGKDAKIEQAIRARFAKSKISVDRFEVQVRDGVATITGRTDVVQRKGAATRLAKAGGAERVVNNIEVSERAKQNASRGLTEARKRAEVKHVPADAPR
jgi:osmotically-inducible protein OsmY